MKKAAITAVMILVVVAMIVVFKSLPAGFALTPPQGNEPSAAGLQLKIETIKKANADKKRRVKQKMDVSEAELETYVMVVLKKDIPIRLESIRVHLTPGSLATDARLNIPPGSTGNALADAIVGGTHNLYIKGSLVAARGEGKFDVQEVRVDGIPVPNFLIDILIKRFAKPKYPDADINAPFDLLWGIDAIDVGQGKATLTY